VYAFQASRGRVGAVPVERVRLGRQTVTDQETVGDKVRKEEIDIDDSATRGR
jgi:stress response protein YsnF